MNCSKNIKFLLSNKNFKKTTINYALCIMNSALLKPTHQGIDLSPLQP